MRGRCAGALLHLDEALRPQQALRREVLDQRGSDLDYRDLGPALRLWSRPEPLDRLRQRLSRDLPTSLGPVAVFAGSGDFHHVTPILLARAVETADDGLVTLVHFDNHPDWVKFGPGLHCGSWVGRAARMPGVAKVVTIGVCSIDIDRPRAAEADLDLLVEDRLELYPYVAPRGAETLKLCGREWPSILSMGEEDFTRFMAGRIATEAIYITIDKDVLRADEAATNWDQGCTSVAFLRQMLRGLAEHHRIIGADVVGDWSKPVFGGGALASLLKRGEALMDQPWRAPPPAVQALNEPVNLELLDLFAEMGR
ncbi:MULTISPECIES: hypothetical protein [unclassified Brevundimonas]|uniref:hypothetical protein n=1 Tax=unclassified Brevundimonas TaxID=2622653 RepID=UPI003F92A11B